MTQWLENLGATMAEQGAASLAELSANKLANVKAAAADALVNPRYNKHQSRYGLPKVKSGLGLWDCVVAPCVEACTVEQDVPEYAWLIAQGVDPGRILLLTFTRRAAAEMLRRESRGIAAIATQVGYEAEAAFNRAFTSTTCMSVPCETSGFVPTASR